ncbi:DUF2523 domain-containing protein [Pseudacidovorax intermedius]|uniref:Cobalt ABC transporter permease n=1 Tax=Pseudacidovorax intermedius TaxID=433924 RepID=A0A147GSL1_9BURK|nr:DUF2523 domain-containing protein [Pseudacidovorax intermedius]KTT20396.1 cobalt ABC transporter permease [Pseudacidovorax intermedius]
MPAILAALGSMLLQIAGSFAGQMLIGAGVAAVTYVGLDASLEWLKSNAVSALLGLPPEVVGMLGVLKVGRCISIVTSAIVMRLTMQGFKDGALKKWTKR